jgi:oligopeptide transport system substrate-binding protein
MPSYIFLAALFLLTTASAFASSVDQSRQAITLSLPGEPTTLDSMKASDVLSFTLINHMQEGLLRYGPRGKLVPAVAESWVLEEKQALFTLRKDALWSDGSQITAHDFVFAWRTVVKPETASEYAFVFYPVKNAEAIANGQIQASSLGVSAIDDFTLLVEFESVCPYFLELTAFGSFSPVKEAFYRLRGERYAADKDDLLFSGPFRLDEWVHGASLKMVKNESYWDKRSIHLNEVNFAYVTSDASARFNLFKNDQIAMTPLNAETVQQAVAAKYKIRTHAPGQVQFLVHNFREGRPTANLDLRRAIQAVYDREEFVNRVTAIPGNIAATSLFPSWINGVEKPFKVEYPAPHGQGPNIGVGNQHLNKARKALGEIPPLVLLLGNSPTSVKMGEYLQGYLKETLGLDLRLDHQVVKQYYDKLAKGSFDIAMWGWLPDYNDILTYADLMASWNLNNRGQYSNPEFDRLVRVIQTSTVPLTRMQAAGELQRILFEDAVILPQMEVGVVYVLNPKVRGVIRRRFGPDPDYTYARVR